MSAHAYTEDQLVEQPAIGWFAELGWQTVSALEETFGAPSPGLAARSAALTRPSATLSRPTGEGQVGEGASFGRETTGEVVLGSRLRAALERLNPALPPEAITAAADELTRDRSAMSLEAANREVYLLLKEGIKVSVPDTGTDSTPHSLIPSFSPSGGEGVRRTVEGETSGSTPHPGPLPDRGGEGVRSKGGGQKTERLRVVDWEHPANNDFLLVSQFSVTGSLYNYRSGSNPRLPIEMIACRGGA